MDDIETGEEEGKRSWLPVDVDTVWVLSQFLKNKWLSVVLGHVTSQLSVLFVFPFVPYTWTYSISVIFFRYGHSNVTQQNLYQISDLSFILVT